MDDLSDNDGQVLTEQRRRHFEGLGVEVVRADLAAGGTVHIGGKNAREAAKLWLAEKDAESRAQNRSATRWQKAGVFFSGANLFLNAALVLGPLAVGLFLGWLFWG